MSPVLGWAQAANLLRPTKWICLRFVCSLFACDVNITQRCLVGLCISLGDVILFMCGNHNVALLGGTLHQPSSFVRKTFFVLRFSP